MESVNKIIDERFIEYTNDLNEVFGLVSDDVQYLQKITKKLNRAKNNQARIIFLLGAVVAYETLLIGMKFREIDMKLSANLNGKCAKMCEADDLK